MHGLIFKLKAVKNIVLREEIRLDFGEFMYASIKKLNKRRASSSGSSAATEESDATPLSTLRSFEDESHLNIFAEHMAMELRRIEKPTDRTRIIVRVEGRLIKRIERALDQQDIVHVNANSTAKTVIAWMSKCDSNNYISLS